MREPAFWHRPSSWKSHLLRPLGALYGAIAARRLQRKGFDAGIPILCVGNYHVGGAGKTPTVLALVQVLRGMGERPVVLSRGYGGKLRGPVTVDPERHGAADVGDEPLMMAPHVPVVVARERIDGAALAKSRGASVILMDDGFQNPSLAKDCSLIVIDGERGVGNGRVFPAGPLRAPLSPQLALTDALVVIGEGVAGNAIAEEVAARCRFDCGAPGKTRACLCRHRRPRPVLPNAERLWGRYRAQANVCRSSPLQRKRDRCVTGGCQSSGVDTCNHREGSRAP
jgi:tetraacyldisaccharide 4'-kinase